LEHGVEVFSFRVTGEGFETLVVCTTCIGILRVDFDIRIIDWRGSCVEAVQSQVISDAKGVYEI
jgi:hypothetical protein